MRVLEVACRRRKRRDRLRILRLIATHGRDEHGDLRALIAHDYPRMQNPHVSLQERYGVRFPELPRLFLTGHAHSGRRTSAGKIR